MCAAYGTQRILALAIRFVANDAVFMCGRFSQPGDMEELLELLPELAIPEAPPPRFNVAPSQLVPTVLNDGRMELSFTRWGLIPSWSKDAAIGNKLINARAESIDEKPSFRTPLKKRRCLIIANGFYEWGEVPGRGRSPVYFRMRDAKPFAFAGLWDEWRDPKSGEPLRTCTIITCGPNEVVRPVHHRMPVILPRTAFADWLVEEPVKDTKMLTSLLVCYPPDQMEAFAVSKEVNKPANEGVQLIEPEQGELF